MPGVISDRDVLTIRTFPYRENLVSKSTHGPIHYIDKCCDVSVTVPAFVTGFLCQSNFITVKSEVCNVWSQILNTISF